jgi:hypothetical protein
VEERLSRLSHKFFQKQQDPLALKILAGDFKEGDTIKVDRGKEGFTFTADVLVVEGEVVA